MKKLIATAALTLGMAAFNTTAQQDGGGQPPPPQQGGPQNGEGHSPQGQQRPGEQGRAGEDRAPRTGQGGGVARGFGVERMLRLHRDRFADQALDGAQEVALVRRTEGNRVAFCASARRRICASSA